MAADSEIESLQAKVRRLEERLHILEAQCTCRLTPVEKTDAESSTAASESRSGAKTSGKSPRWIKEAEKLANSLPSWDEWLQKRIEVSSATNGHQFINSAIFGRCALGRTIVRGVSAESESLFAIAEDLTCSVRETRAIALFQEFQFISMCCVLTKRYGTTEVDDIMLSFYGPGYSANHLKKIRHATKWLHQLLNNLRFAEGWGTNAYELPVQWAYKGIGYLTKIACHSGSHAYLLNLLKHPPPVIQDADENVDRFFIPKLLAIKTDNLLTEQETSQCLGYTDNAPETTRRILQSGNKEAACQVGHQNPPQKPAQEAGSVQYTIDQSQNSISPQSFAPTLGQCCLPIEGTCQQIIPIQQPWSIQGATQLQRQDFSSAAVERSIPFSQDADIESSFRQTGLDHLLNPMIDADTDALEFLISGDADQEYMQFSNMGYGRE